MSRPARKSAPKIIKIDDSKTKLDGKSQMGACKAIADILVKHGASEFDAWTQAGIVLQPKRDYTPNSDVGIMLQDGYFNSRDKSMSKTATRERTNGAVPLRDHMRRSNAPKPPEGTGWAARIARGLILWRDQHGLSIPDAAEKVGVPATAWYKIEKAYGKTLDSHIDYICETIKVPPEELLKLGDTL